MDPKGKSVLIVATFGPEAPARCPAPFMFAQAGAASGAEVSLFFVLQGVRLLKRGIAETVYAKEGGRSMRQFMDEALQAGAKFYVCAAALELNDMTPDDLVDEVENLVGPSFLITKGLEADLVLSF
jgi:predicted peroxiredoxin